MPYEKTKTQYEISTNMFSDRGIIVTWNKNKKSIYISTIKVDTLYYKKNLFLSNESKEWEIIYLDKKGKSKIRTSYNGNTYELQFN